jgi:hypothetical protein
MFPVISVVPVSATPVTSATPVVGHSPLKYAHSSHAVPSGKWHIHDCHPLRSVTISNVPLF